MDNISFVKFTLSGIKESKVKYIYFAFIPIVYFCIILFNLILILTVIRERALHEPMYIFLSNLCCNGLYGTAGFYPKFLYDLLSGSHIISYNGCMLQIFMIYSFSTCEYATLMIMSYDRYVAICRPLEYHAIMTMQAVFKSILVSWSVPFISVLIGVILTNRLPLCGFHIDKLYCDNWSVVKLSCLTTTINNVYGFFVILFFMALGVCIMCSYIKLLNSCRKSKENQNKFSQTCLPHLLSLINFTVAILFDTMFSRYGSKRFPETVRNFLQLEFLIIPPLFNPIIYGLKLTEIRRRVLRQHKKHILSKGSMHARKR